MIMIAMPHGRVMLLLLQATRRRRPEGGEPFPGEPADLHVEIDIPPPLKKQLLDDYDAVHDEGKYIPLPRHPNVGEIAQQYVSYVRDRQAAADIEDEIVAGLKMYFDKTLTHCLLYKHEQAQANKVRLQGYKKQQIEICVQHVAFGTGPCDLQY